MSKIHLNKNGKAKCGATPWSKWSLMEISKNKEDVTCKRCLNKVKRTSQGVKIEKDMVGRIFHTSWGYDMTINEYAKVIKQSPKSILLQMCYTRTNGLEYGPGGRGKATAGSLKPDGEKFRLFRKVRTYKDYFTGETRVDESWAGGGQVRYWSEWDGRESYENHLD